MVQIKLRKKYRTGGMAKQVRAKGGGDSGKSHQKQSFKGKKYDPLKHVMVIDRNGKKRMVHGK